MREVFSVPEVSCQHCVMAISQGLERMAGIKEVWVDVDKKEVTVEYDEGVLSTQKIIKGIEDAGYSVV